MPKMQQAAVVTGSTSGIGKSIAMRLLSSGYRVVLNYAHDDTRAAQTFSDCRKISQDAVLVKADVGNQDEASTLIKRAIDEFGALHVLINNAAMAADSPLLHMTAADWDKVLAVNLTGAFLCSQIAAHQMLQQSEGGVILNIGASTGIRARPNGANTCASKAGLMMLTQCLALELAPKIRVNTIIPGLTITEDTARRFDLHDPGVRQAREATIPMQRLCRPEDVADAVMLMLTSESSFITGQKIVVDGGQNMW